MAGYPLEPLRALRAGVERARTIDLAAALDAERGARTRRDRAAAALASAREAIAGALARGMTAAALASAEAHQRVARDRLAAAEAALARARIVVSDAQASAAQARGEAKVVERHRDRWTADARQRRDRKDDDGGTG
jgi:flagellar export protein FliJ